jgi:TPR repeat protein
MLAQPLTVYLDNAANLDGPRLIRAAGLAQALGQGPVIDLMKAAVAKSSDDPNVLIGAYMLVVGEGLDELMPEAQKWFQRALDLSGPDGPVRQFELKDLLSQQAQWNEHTKFVNEAVVRGDIPLLVAAPGLHTTLVDVILRADPRSWDSWTKG